MRDVPCSSSWKDAIAAGAKLPSGHIFCARCQCRTPRDTAGRCVDCAGESLGEKAKKTPNRAYSRPLVERRIFRAGVSRVDLKLLAIVLYAESQTAAGEKFGLSQSTISRRNERTIDRLMAAGFKTPSYVRRGRTRRIDPAQLDAIGAKQ